MVRVRHRARRVNARCLDQKIRNAMGKREDEAIPRSSVAFPLKSRIPEGGKASAMWLSVGCCPQQRCRQSDVDCHTDAELDAIGKLLGLVPQAATDQPTAGPAP